MSRDHDVEPPIQCPHCQKPFKQTKTKDEHVRTVHEKKYNYWCEGCQYGTQSKLSYEEHLGQNHPEQVTQEYKCSLCSKVCKGPISLKRHMQFRLCTMKKKFQCDVCKKFYKTTAGLNLHKETEHGNKANRPVCQQCGKFFASQGNLKTHLDWHAAQNMLLKSKSKKHKK